MARKLAAYVHVSGVVYPAGSTPPADVAKQITNPKAWAEESSEAPSQESSEAPTRAKGRAAAKRSEK